MIRINMQFDELRALVGNSLQLGPAFRASVRESIPEITDDIYQAFQREYHRPGPGQAFPVIHTGALGASLRVRPNGQGNGVIIRLTASHAEYAEYGRGPGRVPRGIIREWAESKLGVTDPVQIEAIIRSISRSGTTGGQAFQRAFAPGGQGAQQISQTMNQTVMRNFRRRAGSMGWR